MNAEHSKEGLTISTPLERYSDRVATITEILSSVVDLSDLLPNTSEANPVPLPNGLSCSWGAPDTGLTQVSVYINAVDDEHDAIRQLRDKVAEFAYRDNRHDPSSASEVSTDHGDVHVFVFGFFGTVEVLVGGCEVTVATLNRDVDLADLIAPAVEIARTIGCSPYEDDFARPRYPEAWLRQRLVSPPFAPMRKPE